MSFLWKLRRQQKPSIQRLRHVHHVFSLKREFDSLSRLYEGKTDAQVCRMESIYPEMRVAQRLLNKQEGRVLFEMQLHPNFAAMIESLSDSTSLFSTLKQNIVHTLINYCFD